MLFLRIVAVVAASACGVLAVVLGTGKDTWGARHPAFFWSFVVLSILGMLGLVFLTVVEHQEARQATKERAALIGKIDALGEQLAPFVSAAAAFYPDQGQEEALTLLVSEIETLRERTEALEVQLSFQPLDEAIGSLIVQRLRDALGTAGGQPASVRVMCETGSNPRMQVGAEVVSLLADAGYAATGPSSQTTYGTGARPAVLIKCSPSCKGIANGIYSALRLVLKTEFAGQSVESSPDDCQITVVIFGDPLFGADGTVTFR